MDAVPQLTNCFFQQFVDNKAAPDEAPVLQVLEARPMQGQANQILARFSDGIFSYGGCTITPVIIGRFRADGIGSHNAIIQVTNWKRAQLTGKVLFNVLDYNLVSLDFPVIGNPQAHSGNPNDYCQHMQSQAYVQQQQQMISTKQEPENSNASWGASTTGTPNANKRGHGSSPTDDSRQPLSKRQPQQTGGASMAGLTPIEFITPYSNKWRICGIVSAKDTQIKEITNAKGTFLVFGFVITDQAGTSIRVSAFGDVANKVFLKIQNEQVYYVSGDTRMESVRAANRKFNNTGHDYELTLDRDSEVTHCEENFTAPKLKLKPVLLCLIPQRVNEYVDVQAIVERMGDITQVTSRKDQRQLDKRDVFLVDKSGTEICFTLWGDQAQDFNICPGNVIGIKGALVREFNGSYSISTGSGAQIIDNPENECTEQLYLWYRDQKPSQEIRTLSSTETKENNTDESRKSDEFQLSISPVSSSETDGADVFINEQIPMTIDKLIDYFNCRAFTVTKIRFGDRSLMGSALNENLSKTIVQTAGEQLIGQSQYAVQNTVRKDKDGNCFLWIEVSGFTQLGGCVGESNDKDYLVKYMENGMDRTQFDLDP